MGAETNELVVITDAGEPSLCGACHLAHAGNCWCRSLPYRPVYPIALL